MYISDSLLTVYTDETLGIIDSVVLIDQNDNIIATELDLIVGIVGFNSPEPGVIELDEDLTYQILEGETVYGYRIVDSAESFIYGANLENPETFANDGTFTVDTEESKYRIEPGDE